MKFKERTGDTRSAKTIKADIDEKRIFVKEVLWPYLVAQNLTIDKAKKLLYYSDWFLQETKKADILRLSKELDAMSVELLPPYSPISTKSDYNDEQSFIKLFKGRILADVSALILGLKDGLQKSIDDGVKDNHIETIDTKTFIQD